METTGKTAMMLNFGERQIENRRRKIALAASMEAKSIWLSEINLLRDREPSWDDVERITIRVAEHAAYLAAEQTEKHLQNDVQMVTQFVDSRLSIATLTPPNNTLHPNHSETAQERPAPPASGEAQKYES